jgi:hypothetical protein
MRRAIDTWIGDFETLSVHSQQDLAILRDEIADMTELQSFLSHMSHDLARKIARANTELLNFAQQASTGMLNFTRRVSD